jgi:WD40 repeat protein/beta-lactamase regulating signal transducer with metallopeptidase domain
VSLVGWLNVLGGTWAGFMVRALVDSSVLLAVLLLFWLPLRRKLSAQLAYGLFLLVLLKLAVPVSFAGLAWAPLPSPESLFTRVKAGLDPGSATASAPPGPMTAQASAPVPAFPTTGDFGANSAEPSLPEPRTVRVAALDTPRTAIKPATRTAPESLTIEAALMLCWSVLAALLLVRLAGALWSTERLVRRAQPLAPASLSVDLEALRRAAGIRRRVAWATSAALQSPAVGGLIRPTVVLPPDLGAELTSKQLSWVLLHELAHIRRQDLWVVVVQRFAQAVFFFHPAVHVANWIIDQLREYACDDAALVASRSSRRDCGEGFLVIVGRHVERPVPLSPSLGLFESQTLIRRRLARILDPRRDVQGRLSPLAALGLLAVSVLVLPTGWGHQAAARLLTPAHPGSSRAVSAAPRRDNGGATEPTNYGPGEVLLQRTVAARNGVLALGYSPDGATLAMAGEDAVVVLREVATGRVRARLEGHHDTVACLAYAPDGRTIVTGGYDRTLRLWDAASGRPGAVLKGHTNWVVAVACSPDGQLLASAGYDKTVRLWDAASGRALAVLTGHSSSVRCLAFSPDGRWLASGSTDRLAIVWDMRQRKPRLRLAGHAGTIRAAAYSADGAILATAGEDANVKLWDMPGGRARVTLTGHSDMVHALAFSPAGRTLATASLDATVKLWDVRTQRERATLQGHSDGVSALAFAPRGRQLATGSYDGSVRLWEPVAPMFVPTACFAGPDAVESLAFERSGRALLALGGTKVLARWDAHTGAALDGSGIGAGMNLMPPAPRPVDAAVGPDGVLRVRETATGSARFALHSEDLRAHAFSPDGAILATGHSGGNVLLWDARDGRELAVLKGHRHAVKAIAFAPDSRALATLDAERAVKLWSLEVRRLTAAATLKPGPQFCLDSLAYAPDGATLAVADGPVQAAGGVTLWDLATRRPRVALEGHERGVAAVAFSANGATLASADWSGIVRLWDAATGTPRDAFEGPQRVSRLVFSADGSMLAAVGQNRSVTLWHLESGSELGRFSGPGSRVLGLAFSRDGRHLAIGGGDIEPVPGAKGEVTIWDVASRSRLAALSGHTRAVLALAFSPDGTTLATSGLDATVRLWNLATGQTRLVLGGLPCWAQSMAFSPDGRVLALGGRGDAIVALHDTETGSEVGRLVGHCGLVRDLAFAPDGQSLATAGADGAIKLWDLSTVADGER